MTDPLGGSGERPGDVPYDPPADPAVPPAGDPIDRPVPPAAPPAEPYQPAEPTSPVEPVSPIEPVEPASPIEPTSPIEPVAPVEPVPPTPPVEPVAPDEPIAPTSPIEPVAPTSPVEPVVPTSPIEPVEPAAPAVPVADVPPDEEPATAVIAPVAAESVADEEPVAKPAKGKRRKEEEQKHEGSFLRELPVLLIIALGLALLIKAFVVQAFFIPSGSMEQTLHGCPGCRGDRVLVNKFVYRFRDIHHGEIVVFNGLDSFQAETVVPPPRNGFDSLRRKVAAAIGLGQPGERDYIKRVIGLPGDTVACCTNGNVTVNGVELHEPYLYEDDHRPFGPITVPRGKLWVMGDHRGASQDSRACRCAVPMDKVAGRAFVVIWPPARVKGLRVPHQIEDAHIPKPHALPAPPWSVAATPPVLGLALALPVNAARRRRLRRRRRKA